jgi:hypothetical protein
MKQREPKPISPEGNRKRAIELVRRHLVRGGWPRLLVSFLLALTGAAGFLISSALLHLGVTLMAVRYPLAVFLAYSVFLLLLRLWLALQRTGGSALDLFPDIGDGIPNNLFDSGTGAATEAATFGGGADFGGAGTGGSWTGGGASPSNLGSDLSGGSSIMDSVPDVPDVGLDFDLGEGCFWIVIPIIAIAGVIFAMFYVVYAAPVLLAEMLVDALLVAGLYKRLKGIEPRYWLRSVVRRTLWPVLIATALFIAAGYLMGRIAPEAHSIGGFWREINTPKDRR